MSCDLDDDITGIKYRFFVNDSEDNNSEVMLEITGNEDNTFTFDKKWKHVFCFGKKVNDLKLIDKQKIFALHHSAIQELDKKINRLDNTFTTHSDVNDTRLISNINEYDTKDSLNVINNIPLKSYNSKEGDSKLGFVSNDVQQVIPESVERTNQYKPDIMEIINKPEYTEINPNQFEVKFSYQSGLNKDTNILVKAGLGFQFDKPNKNKNTWFR